MGRRIAALFIAIAGLAPCAVLAQATFTYSASDYQAQTVTTPTQMTFAARTVIVIAPGFNALPQIAGPTKSIPLTLKSPAGPLTLLRVILDNKLVETTIRGSNADGDLQTSVDLPVILDPDKTLTIEWKAADGSLAISTMPLSGLPH